MRCISNLAGSISPTHPSLILVVTWVWKVWSGVVDVLIVASAFQRQNVLALTQALLHTLFFRHDPALSVYTEKVPASVLLLSWLACPHTLVHVF